jgi:hypothetical protein
MSTPLFLTSDELRELTGRAVKAKQIEQLRRMCIAFRVNGCGRPVVTRTAVEGHPETASEKPSWTPTVLQGRR